jgi:hypothetical protein
VTPISPRLRSFLKACPFPSLFEPRETAGVKDVDQGICLVSSIDHDLGTLIRKLRV